MVFRHSHLVAALAASTSLLCAAPLQAAPVGSSFTYQGELRTAGAPSEGAHDFQVALYGDASGGSAIDTIEVADAPVDDGLFSLPLDFTGAPFETGEQYWLELRVRDGASAGAYTTLLPRQALTATPYALNALSVRDGSVGNVAIDPTQVQRRVSGSCAVGQSITAIADDGTVSCAALGSGTITGVGAGSGLEGGGTAGNVTLAIGASAVNATHIDASSVQRRVAGSCDEGESIASIASDGSVSCVPDQVGAGTIEGVQPGTGLTGGGNSGVVVVGVAPGGIGANEIDASAVQRRIATGCDVGFTIRAIAENGTPTCQADANSGGDIMGVNAGFGLTGGGGAGSPTLAVNTATVQRRVGAACGANEAIRAINEDGSITCEPDSDTGITGWQIVTFTRQYFGGSGGTSSADGEARCPLGKRVIGGGVDAGCGGAYVDKSYPRDIPGGVTTSGWWGHVLKRSDAVCNDNPATMTVYAICVNLN